MSLLVELLERVKAARGPDREIDKAIALQLEGWTFERRKPHDAKEYWRKPDGAWYQRETVSPYTASIEAALALTERVLPGSFYSVSRHVGLMKRKRKDKTVTPFEAYVANHDRIGEPGYVFALPDPAPTPSLAIIAATLQALIAKESP